MIGKLIDELRSRANYRGRVITHETALLEELQLTHDELGAQLAELERTGLVEVLSPLPFLVLKLRSWSGSRPDRVPNEQRISSPKRDARIEVPVSSAAAAATQQLEVGGAGEGEALLDEVLAVLGPDADRDEFRVILAKHHAALIHRCLKRVQATKSIRVSRAALFRSLLDRLSH